jgi:hypothetical protein
MTTAPEAAATEFAGIELGDKRLERRLQKLVASLEGEPCASFPKAAASDAELEGTYRFLSNERVDADAVLEPHLKASTRRCAEHAVVIVAHDTTEFTFGSFPRGDLGATGRGDSYGFLAHVSLAVSFDEARIPLGVVGIRRFNRRFGSRRSKNGGYKSDEGNTFLRWGEQAEAVDSRLGRRDATIHVMDREADDFTLLSALATDGYRFVIRSTTNRRVEPCPNGPRVRDEFPASPVLARREVHLSRRRPPTKRSHRTKHPPRDARTANFEIRARTVEIAKSQTASKTSPRTLALNLVHVCEIGAPADVEPVEWWLWTTEPIATERDVLAIVDAYRSRWRIEEFFKALKTGCAFEKRQLESSRALYNALSVFLPIAWRLLLLRAFGSEETRSADLALSTSQIECLRAVLRHRHRFELADKPSVRDAMLGIARLGGHIRNNGDPGWAVLGRGLDRLLTFHVGYELALQRSDQ